MKYPVDKENFVAIWLENQKKVYGSVRDVDRQFAENLVVVINDAYAAGLKDGQNIESEA